MNAIRRALEAPASSSYHGAEATRGSGCTGLDAFREGDPLRCRSQPRASALTYAPAIALRSVPNPARVGAVLAEL